jgi:hypothetical protein
MLVDPLRRIAGEAAHVWDDKRQLDLTLMAGLATLPYVKYLYALDPDGLQVSDNASREGLIPEDFGRDRSGRPYMAGLAPGREMVLSEAYISLRAKRPSLTAIQRVVRHDALLGYLGADVDLRDLPLTRKLYQEPARWHQMKGDPAIRGQLFRQRRIESQLDRHIDEVAPVIEELMTESGVFHGKIHFSSSRATIWLIDDPFRYRILGFDEIVDPDICLAYPHRPYPEDAVIPPGRIGPILDTFRHLRFADETIYLRAGSLNIFNGIVSLNFSCDGSHYIPYDQFLARDSTFWEGIA